MHVSLLVRLWVEMFDYWNIFRLRKVSLLVRLWVEILLPTALKSAVRRQPPCEAVSWNIWFWVCCCSSTVSLLVRLWVEIIFCHHYTMLRFVSLLVRLWVEICNLTTIIWNIICQPPCEAVSWNVIASFLTASKEGQPPCEAVSWMKSRFRAVCTAMVSLLVRLWVEIASPWLLSLLWTSASLWGCELKCLIQDASLSVSRQPPCEAVSWNASRGRLKYPTFVSLLVRLWVEMLMYLLSFSHTLMSASLWGCELK